jgi:hypothetical protein
VNFEMSNTYFILGVEVMVFNATFNNISVIYRSAQFLLMKETGVPEENHRPAASH